MPPSKKPPLEPARELTAEILVYSATPADTQFEVMREHYAVFVRAHEDLYKSLVQTREKVDAAKLSAPEMCDITFAIREIKAIADDIDKEINVLLKRLALAVCIQWVMDAASDPDVDDKIEGQFCTGFPDVKDTCVPPTFAKDPKRYNELCDFLQIPEMLRDRGKELFQEGEFRTKIVDIDWNGFQDYIRRLQLNGYPMPPGIDQETVFKEQKLTVRKKRDLLPPVKQGS